MSEVGGGEGGEGGEGGGGEMLHIYNSEASSYSIHIFDDYPVDYWHYESGQIEKRMPFRDRYFDYRIWRYGPFNH